MRILGLFYYWSILCFCWVLGLWLIREVETFDFLVLSCFVVVFFFIRFLGLVLSKYSSNDSREYEYFLYINYWNSEKECLRNSISLV